MKFVAFQQKNMTGINKIMRVHEIYKIDILNNIAVNIIFSESSKAMRVIKLIYLSLIGNYLCPKAPVGNGHFTKIAGICSKLYRLGAAIAG
jgi:hypothetical protein